MKTDRAAADWREMVEAVEILSPQRFRVLGRSYEAGADLNSSLAERLYSRLYCRSAERSLPFDGRDADRHRELLSRANAGSRLQQGGWRLGQALGAEVTDTEVMASKNGVSYRVEPSRIRSRTAKPEPGEEIEVMVAGELRHQPAGFFSVLGQEAPASPFLLRLYWHLTPAGAIVLVRELTAVLVRLAIPWGLKVLGSPAHYRRADAGVLYLRPGGFEKLRGVLAKLYPRLAGGLRAEVPRMTLRLAPGLGLAEGRGDGASFGQDRCQLVAGALVTAFEQGRRPSEVVDDVFRAAGIDPAKPYLESGSQRSYRLPRAKISLEATRPRQLKSPGGDFLASALDIGLALCRDAFRHGGRCSWVAFRRDRGPANLASLGADLYLGLAGVAFFLAELHTVTGEAVLASVARGAALQALHLERRSPLGQRLSLFEGGLGVAWAVSKVGRRLGDEQLTSAADSLSAELLALPGGRELDFLSGRAGALALLLDFYRGGGSPTYLEAARLQAEEIRRAVRLEPGGATWPCDLPDLEQPLTGLAHGSSGIGLPVLLLSRALGEAGAEARGAKPWAELFLAALTHEDALFNFRYGNWPDLRKAEASFPMAWCHGTPGILLARLRALQLAPELAPRIGLRVPTALAALLASLEKRARDELADVSLCHGTCGWIETARMAGIVLGDRRAVAAAEGAMESLLGLHGETRSWPSGLRSGRPCPGLMLGEAGIGLCLLHLSRPEAIPPLPLIF